MVSHKHGFAVRNELFQIFRGAARSGQQMGSRDRISQFGFELMGFPGTTMRGKGKGRALSFCHHAVQFLGRAAPGGTERKRTRVLLESFLQVVGSVVQQEKQPRSGEGRTERGPKHPLCVSGKSPSLLFLFFFFFTTAVFLPSLEMVSNAGHVLFQLLGLGGNGRGWIRFLVASAPFLPKRLKHRPGSRIAAARSLNDSQQIIKGTRFFPLVRVVFALVSRGFFVLVGKIQGREAHSGGAPDHPQVEEFIGIRVHLETIQGGRLLCGIDLFPRFWGVIGIGKRGPHSRCPFQTGDARVDKARHVPVGMLGVLVKNNVLGLDVHVHHVARVAHTVRLHQLCGKLENELSPLFGSDERSDGTLVREELLGGKGPVRNEDYTHRGQNLWIHRPGRGGRGQLGNRAGHGAITGAMHLPTGQGFHDVSMGKRKVAESGRLCKVMQHATLHERIFQHRVSIRLVRREDEHLGENRSHVRSANSRVGPLSQSLVQENAPGQNKRRGGPLSLFESRKQKPSSGIVGVDQEMRRRRGCAVPIGRIRKQDLVGRERPVRKEGRRECLRLLWRRKEHRLVSSRLFGGGKYLFWFGEEGILFFVGSPLPCWTKFDVRVCGCLGVHLSVPRRIEHTKQMADQGFLLLLGLERNLVCLL
mmetsp:Transcript_39992/g.103263  ORF Transcript_39992/g.103263 Transcript_39992/m.103263 type:complete len:645 (+) Transcript_39992:2398-4332(+)